MYFFIEFEPLCQKLSDFLSNFGLFYYAHSPNMVMPRDPSWKFENFKCCPNSTFNIRKSHKIPMEKFSKKVQKVISQKRHGGRGPLPVPLGLRECLRKLVGCVSKQDQLNLDTHDFRQR